MTRTTKGATAPTIRRTKSRAKAIRKEAGVAHHEALDTAAREAGFENFKHQQNEAHKPVSGVELSLLDVATALDDVQDPRLPRVSFLPNSLHSIGKLLLSKLMACSRLLLSDAVGWTPEQAIELNHLRGKYHPNSVVQPHHLQSFARGRFHGDPRGESPSRLSTVPTEFLSGHVVVGMERIARLEERHSHFVEVQKRVRAFLDSIDEDGVDQLDALAQVGMAIQSTIPLEIALEQATRLSPAQNRSNIMEALMEPAVFERAIARLQAKEVVSAAWERSSLHKLTCTKDVFEDAVAMQAAIRALNASCKILIRVGRPENEAANILMKMQDSLHRYLSGLNPRERAELTAVAWRGMGLEDSFDYLVAKIQRGQEYSVEYVAGLDLERDLALGLKLI